ncbi:alpha/beta hydrolase [Colwellia sp. 75C3]|uniref:alpha/beta hydrolase family protein n=1 Tax=Colwellia sp. 75C3 TaxID=888425 RepID=UPI000C32C67A|nr:alpha/beta hydrolase [Colwellia sp. 75C3]PKG83028.1 alpha/beta hydrolase [Colwellia sp. 75C3]
MTNHLKKIIFYGRDSQQFAHLYKPNSTKILPIVVVIHGGYWKDSHSLDSYATSAIVDYLQGFDTAIWNLEYRRMDAIGENIKAPWPATFKDIAAGLDHLKTIANEENLDLNRVLLIGHSAGGHLTTWAASRSNIAPDSELYEEKPLSIHSVISIAAISNLFNAGDVDQPEQIQRLMGGCANTKAERYLACDPSTLYSEDINLTLVHGAQDTCVNISQTQHYCDNAKGVVDQIIMPNADHFSMLPHDGQWQAEEWQQLKTLIAEKIKTLGSA